MGWARVSDPSSIVKPGDEVTVKVLRIDADKNKISLGLKQLQADPWAKVTEHYAVGQVNEGRVTRLSDFGAFVELEPGVEALAHVSTFPPTQAQDGWKTSVPAASPARSKSSASNPTRSASASPSSAKARTSPWPHAPRSSPARASPARSTASSVTASSSSSLPAAPASSP
jgi:RecJ-like exonuclease